MELVRNYSISLTLTLLGDEGKSATRVRRHKHAHTYVHTQRDSYYCSDSVYHLEIWIWYVQCITFLQRSSAVSHVVSPRMPIVLPDWLPVAFGCQAPKQSDFWGRSRLLSSATSRWHQRAQAATHLHSNNSAVDVFLAELTHLYDRAKQHIQKHLWLETLRVN